MNKIGVEASVMLHRRFAAVEDRIDEIRSSFDGYDGPHAGELAELERELISLHERIHETQLAVNVAS